MATKRDRAVKSLGPRTIRSPVGLAVEAGSPNARYVPDEARVRFEIEASRPDAPGEVAWFEKAGPREHIFFEPKKTRAAIVTCGGLCPGINGVIRGIVLELHHRYGVRDVLGVRYGFEGLDPKRGLPPIPLGPEQVRFIHELGGSRLGVSRGRQDIGTMVDTLVHHGVTTLFVIGGDGSLRGAHAIHEEIAKRGLAIAVVGVPKTIDNDVPFVDKTFGFETAVELAHQAIQCAHAEAISARGGIGLVKLMGRDSGFIAATASASSVDVNFCLVPEVPFDLGALLAAIETRIAERGHAVIVVAEGCARSFAGEDAERDASGNVRYSNDEIDVGPRLRDAIAQHFEARGTPTSVKYIDPSYIIRSVPPNSADSLFCDTLARCAVHAGMAGKTDLVVGRWHRVFTHVPLELVTSETKRLETGSQLWLSVIEGTGQALFKGS